MVKQETYSHINNLVNDIQVKKYFIDDGYDGNKVGGTPKDFGHKFLVFLCHNYENMNQ